MPITARFLNLILVITNVQSSTQICPPNFIPLPASGTCPASRSCRSTSNCCGSCTGANNICYAYTFGSDYPATCSNTPISCPAGFEPLPTDETGSRPSGSCPPWRPYQSTNGCCGACRTATNLIMPYDCGNTCSTLPGPGCQSTKYGTSAPPPPPLLSDEDAVGLAVGVIILIIIGAIIGACVCVGALVCVCMRQRQASRGQPQFSNYVSNAQPSSSHVPAVQIAMATPVYGADGKPAWQAA